MSRSAVSSGRVPQGADAQFVQGGDPQGVDPLLAWGGDPPGNGQIVDPLLGRGYPQGADILLA